MKAPLIILSFIFLSSCTSVVKFSSKNSNSSQTEIQEVMHGKASYYADKFHGRATASGEIFDQGKLTAAHKTLPFGTLVKVTNLENGKSVRVIINDRGPFVSGRIIDLSKAAAEEIGMIQTGIVEVKVEILRR